MFSVYTNASHAPRPCTTERLPKQPAVPFRCNWNGTCLPTPASRAGPLGGWRCSVKEPAAVCHTVHAAARRAHATAPIAKMPRGSASSASSGTKHSWTSQHTAHAGLPHTHAQIPRMPDAGSVHATATGAGARGKGAKMGRRGSSNYLYPTNQPLLRCKPGSRVPHQRLRNS